MLFFRWIEIKNEDIEYGDKYVNHVFCQCSPLYYLPNKRMRNENNDSVFKVRNKSYSDTKLHRSKVKLFLCENNVKIGDNFYNDISIKRGVRPAILSDKLIMQHDTDLTNIVPIILLAEIIHPKTTFVLENTKITDKELKLIEVYLD